jgi:hypothetical protein
VHVDDQTNQLSWTDNSSVEDGYVIYRADQWNEYGWPDYYPIGTAPANATSYVDSGLGPDMGMLYVIVSARDGGWGAASNEAAPTSPIAAVSPSIAAAPHRLAPRARPRRDVLSPLSTRTALRTPPASVRRQR